MPPPRNYEVSIGATAAEDLAALPMNRFDTITRRIDAMKHGIPGSVKRLSNFGYDYRCGLVITGFYLTCRAVKLRFDASSIVAMPTLPHPVRKREKANTKNASFPTTGAVVSRKATAKRKTAKRRLGSVLMANGSHAASDELDSRLIREARQSDRGRQRHSINELRTRRGLSAL